MKINSEIKKLLPYYISVFLFAFLLYGNSIRNEYSLDDEMVTKNNARVEKGIKGIPEILTRYHTIDSKSQYEYRPLVLISYALEYQFLGRNPHISHFINVLIYALTCVLIFYLLSMLFHNYNFIFPLLATLLYSAHPLHSEVVNNLKSRDELLAVFNGFIALFFFLRFAESNKKNYLLLGFLLLFLAVLSKKSALVFIPIIPLTIYFFKNAGWKKILLITFFSIASFGVFAFFKRAMVSEIEIRAFSYFENPLFFETDLFKRIPAMLYTLWYYIELLFFPHPLSFYYGYDHVPIAGWTNPKVWISLVFYSTIFFIALKLFLKKHILSYAILFYLIAVFPFSNFLIPLVGIIGERFVYIASLGFCLAISFLLMKAFKIPTEQTKNKIKLNPLFVGLSAIILILCSFKTITRNPDWKDNLTLYRHDIKHLDKSAKAHSIISNTIYPQLFSMNDGLLRRNLINEAILHYKKSLEIYPDYTVSNNNLGSIYFSFLGDFKTALPYFKKAIDLDPMYVEAHYNLAYTYEKLNMPDSAIFFLEKTIMLKPTYKLAYNKLYDLYFSEGKFDEAIRLNLQAAENMPGISAEYFVNAGNIYSSMHDTLQALNYFIKAFEQEPFNRELCIHIAKVYRRINNETKAEEFFRRAEEIK